MDSSWICSNNSSHISGDLVFSVISDKLNITSNMVVSIPNFLFSQDSHEAKLLFDIYQETGTFELQTSVTLNNDYIDNLDMSFTVNDLGFPEKKYITGIPFTIQNIRICISEKTGSHIFNIQSQKKLSFTTASASCLLKGTKINTKDGWKNIEDLVEGDCVLNQ